MFASKPVVITLPFPTLDLGTHEAVIELLSTVDPTGSTVIDFSEVTFCDSLGLRAVIDVYARHREAGGTLRVRSLGSQPSELLAVTGLDAHLVE